MAATMHPFTRIRNLLLRASNTLRIEWVRRERETWLSRNLDGPLLRVPKAPQTREIERLANQANCLGPQPIWEGYGPERHNATRTAGEVRTNRVMGSFFTYLVRKKRPSVVVEFGAAFGVSGMFWLSGLESNGYGKLLSFEPNAIWAETARANLSAIGTRFQLVTGTFEENIDACLAGENLIEVAFIDAIHTSEFVFPQFELVAERLAPRGIVLLDDIHFSPDMASCWSSIASDDRVRASAVISSRVGIVELG